MNRKIKSLLSFKTNSIKEITFNKNKLAYIIIAFLIFSSDGVTDYSYMPISIVVIFLFSIIVAWLNNKLRLYHFISYFTLVYVLIHIIYYFEFGHLELATIKLYLLIISVYFYLKVYEIKFFYIFENIVFYLAIISLILFSIQIIDANFLINLFKPFNISVYTQKKAGGVFVGIFNINPWHLDRNSGFMWEPGAFGAMLDIALIWNIIRNNYKVDIRFIILVLAAISTYSTTTYLILLIIALIYVLKFKFKIRIIIFPILFIVGWTIWQLPFMQEKILSNYGGEINPYYYLFTSSPSSDDTSVGRFVGFLIQWNNFIQRPILGWGYQQDYTEQGIFQYWSNPNGMSDLMGKFGLIGMIFIIFSLYKGFSTLGKIYDFRGAPLFVLIIILFSSSNPLQTNVFFWSLILFYYGFNLYKMDNKKLSLTKTQN